MIHGQDFYNPIDKELYIVQGDTLSFNFQIAGLAGAEPSFIMTCINHFNDADALFTATSEDGEISQIDYDAEKDTYTYSLRVPPAKTKGLDLARLYYDLKLLVNSDTITLMRGKINILYQVGKG